MVNMFLLRIAHGAAKATRPGLGGTGQQSKVRMAEGFYYDIYPSMRIGGGPSREVYSVEQQAQDARLGALREAVATARTVQSYKELGLYYPVEVATEPLERSGGVLVNSWA